MEWVREWRERKETLPSTHYNAYQQREADGGQQRPFSSHTGGEEVMASCFPILSYLLFNDEYDDEYQTPGYSE